MADRADLESAITVAETEAAIHDLVENGILGLNALHHDFAVPEGHVAFLMTNAQKDGLIESGSRLRRAVAEISGAFYATTGARDGARRG